MAHGDRKKKRKRINILCAKKRGVGERYRKAKDKTEKKPQAVRGDRHQTQSKNQVSEQTVTWEKLGILGLEDRGKNGGSVML